jgi:nucleotide-binding universal stress UspA family protein
MYKHVLIATDGSELAGRAVATGLALAKALKAEVTGVTVTEPWAAVVAEGFPYREYQKPAAEQAGRILAAVTDAAKGSGLECATVHVPDRYPAEGIVNCANEKVMRPDRYGLARTPRPVQAAPWQRNDTRAHS